MRFPFLVGLCLSLATTSLFAASAEFSEDRALPPLKLSAADLDTILHKAHASITAANVAAGDEGSARESVKLGVRGREIEIPHFSLASSVAFPREVLKFSYIYNQPGKPISSVIIDLSDYSRHVSVTGESEDQVQATSNLIETDLRHFSRPIGGALFRRAAGMLLAVVFLTFLCIGGTLWWRSRTYSALGMFVCSAVGLLLVLLLPWDSYLPGFALYQSYSPFPLIRYAPQIFSLILIAALLGIPLSYFLSLSRRRD